MSRIYLFSSPRLDHGERSVGFLPDKRYQLLAYLAARSDWVGRDVLATLFWPEKPTADARHSLRQLLRRTRKLEFTGALEAERERLRWLVETDLQAFGRALEAKRYSELFDLYRGRFLEGMDLRADGDFATWLEYERGHVHAGYRRAMLHWIGSLEGLRQFGRAVRVATTLLEYDPFDEDAMRILLQLADAAGERRPALRRFERFAQDLDRELEIEPSADIQRLARTVERGRAAPPTTNGAAAPAAASSLPASRQLPPPRSPFVGRDREIAELIGRLARSDCRVLTVSGMGGMGKSRLVAQARPLLEERYDDGVVFVALETLTDPNQVPSAIAHALGAPLASQGEVVAQLARAVGDSRALLVLDNFEHLMPSAFVVAGLVRACPKLDVLITSREILDLQEEWLLEIGGLPGPVDGAPFREALRADAVRLFVQRARRVRIDFDLDPEALAHAIRIARAVDGSPLGLELAASWVRRMPLADIAAGIERDLDLLRNTSRDRLERHASLRVTFEHSWRLLTDPEQRALSDLAVFRGGFTAEAAAAVTAAPVALLGALTDKSLLRVGRDGRYDRHPLLHRYSREKLAADPERNRRVRARHAHYYRHQLQRPDEVGGAAPEVLAAEWENVRTVFYWMAEQAAPRELLDWLELLDVWFDARMRFFEALEYLSYAERCLHEREGVPAAALGCVRIHRGWYLFRLGQYEEAYETTERGLEVLRERPSDHLRLQVRGVNTLGAAADLMGRFELAIEHFRTALALARNTTDEQVANGLNNLAIAEENRGDYRTAERHFLEAIAIHERNDRATDVVRTRSNLGALYALMGRLRDARRICSEAIDQARRIGFEQAVPYLLVTLGELDLQLGEPDRAGLRLREALDLGERHGAVNLQVIALANLSDVAHASGAAEEARAFARRALRLAWGAGDLQWVIAILLRWIEREPQGDAEDVAPLLSTILEHPATTAVDRTRARERLERLQPDASARGRGAAAAATLEGFVAALLRGS